jgi:hypothetical protein
LIRSNNPLNRKSITRDFVSRQARLIIGFPWDFPTSPSPAGSCESS